MKLVILCVDGLDPDSVREYGLTMPHERKLSIPKELYYEESPHTLFVWPSIFTGEFCPHQGFIDRKRKLERTGPRKIINQFLLSHGVQWQREGKIISKHRETNLHWDTQFVPYDPEIEKTILDPFNAYTFNIPGVSYGFLMGGNMPYYQTQHETFRMLASMITFSEYEVAALYTAIIDHLDHRGFETFHRYDEIITLARRLGDSVPIMVVSDHGTVNGEHTDHAYLGCTEPIKASCVTEVYRDILNILNPPSEAFSPISTFDHIRIPNEEGGGSIAPKAIR